MLGFIDTADRSLSSQQVDVKYGIDFHHYLAATHKYIVVTVDGRGTGWKGRKLRNPVKDKLGYYETIDQINAAKCVVRLLGRDGMV